MAYLENWPLGSRENITVGNPEADLAVTTLWTRRHEVTDFLSADNYSIVGQLYEKYGISYLLRNLAANPHTRKLVICGADLSGSGQALLKLWQDGVSPEHTIPGIDKSPIQKEIPIETIDQVRHHVELIDYRHLRGQELQARLQQIAYLSEIQGPWGRPMEFPSSEIILGATLPSETGSHTLAGRNIAETWLKMLREVMEYGQDAPTNYGNQARDLSNLVAVVTDEDPTHPYIPEYFNFTPSDVAEYVDEFTSPNLPDGLFYTYGERYRRFGPLNIGGQDIYLDQERLVIDKLRKDPNDRGAIAILYSPIKDNQLDRDEKLSDIRTSCIVSYQFSVKNEALELLTVFRSNDIFSAWPRNAFGLRSVQSRVAESLNLQLGPLVTISTRAHIYEDKWSFARQLVDEQVPKIKEVFNQDSRGNLAITADNSAGQILFLQQDKETGQPLRAEIKVDGKRNRATIAASHEIAKHGLISRVDHALDIGAETLKAEIAIKAGLDYRQDDPNFLKDVIELIKAGQKYRQQNP